MDVQALFETFHTYTLYVRGFSPDTVRRNRNALRLFAKQSGIASLSQVNPAAVRNWIFQGRTMRQWSPATCRTYHKCLKVFFDWCVREGSLASNPATDVELPKNSHKIPKKLTKQEALRLLEVAYNYPYADPFNRLRNHAVLATFIYAGLRKGEVLKLKYVDVDVPNLVIFVRDGKGSKDRMVPMSQALAKILSRYAKERDRLGRSCPEFFIARRQNVGMSYSALRNLIRKVEASAGISFSAHALRHTFATLMLEGGCDLYSLSRMLGHTDIKTTTIYLAATVEHLRAQISKHPLNG